jgi:streptomycin 6-kinase
MRDNPRRNVSPSPTERRAAELLAGQEDFIRRVRSRGAEGTAFLRTLGATIDECEIRWGVRVVRTPWRLSQSFVAAAERADGTPCVLKLDAREEEVEALRLFDGRGSARVLEMDAERRWLLMERVTPGSTLAALTDDDEATRIGARVMQQLWRPAPDRHRLETLEERGGAFARQRPLFGGGTGPFPQHLVEAAERVFAELPVGVEPMVLHGDAHHYNILRAANRSGSGRAEWLTIDPHGLAGDPGYEVGCFIYNPNGNGPIPGDALSPQKSADPRARVARRVAILAEELGWERERVRLWCLAQSVLSAWWSTEDGDVTDEDVARSDTLPIAQLLYEMAPPLVRGLR